MQEEEVEFLSFDETPEEKYLGVASIRFFGRIILRYKVQKTKDGNGIFIAAPSFKKTDPSGEHWCQWFMLDSMSQNESVTNLIKTKVKLYFSSKAAHGQSSNQNTPAFAQQAQGGQNYSKNTSASNGWNQPHGRPV
jgi:hypothetical protein